MAGTAREQIVEALGLDPDYNDADEYSFADIMERAREAGEALRARETDPPDDPREQAFIWRIADEVGVPREQATGSHLVRLIRQACAERGTFRAHLDNALVPLVKRARKLRLDDLLYDVESGRIGVVKRVAPDAFGVTLDVLSLTTGKVRTDLRYDHPDEEVTVLMSLVERDGLLLLRKSLGVQLVDYDPDTDTPEPTGEAS